MGAEISEMRVAFGGRCAQVSSERWRGRATLATGRMGMQQVSEGEEQHEGVYIYLRWEEVLAPVGPADAYDAPGARMTKQGTLDYRADRALTEACRRQVITAGFERSFVGWLALRLSTRLRLQRSQESDRKTCSCFVHARMRTLVGGADGRRHKTPGSWRHSSNRASNLSPSTHITKHRTLRPPAPYMPGAPLQARYLHTSARMFHCQLVILVRQNDLW